MLLEVVKGKTNSNQVSHGLAAATVKESQSKSFKPIKLYTRHLISADIRLWSSSSNVSPFVTPLLGLVLRMLFSFLTLFFM